MTLASLSFRQLDWLHLHGPWCAELAPLFAERFPSLRIHAARASHEALELTGVGGAKRPALRSPVWAGSPRGDRISIHSDAAIPLFQPGVPLPALYLDEGFASAQFFQKIGLFVGHDGEPQQIATIPLPRLYEQRPYCRLRLRILADTPAYIVTLGELAIDANTHLSIFDKHAGTMRAVDRRIVSQIYRESSFERGRAF